MRPLAHLVVCGAPPAADVTQLITLLQAEHWDVCVIPTASALGWLDVPSVERLTAHPVQTEARKPDEAKRLPKAELVIVAPATFNTINKWVLGINDTPALGVLNEALGSGLPIVASPYAKASLAAHPAFPRNLETLASYGVKLTPTEALRPSASNQPFRWDCVLDPVKELFERA